MNRPTILIALSLLSLAAGCGGPGADATVPQAAAAGESMKDIGDHVVHFSAQTTDNLTPEVARAFDIVRSKNRAMLTVSIIREADNAGVEGDVSVRTQNLTGQLKSVPMQKKVEQDAIYYVGETGVANRETLIFDISVTPAGSDETAELRFKREFYTD